MTIPSRTKSHDTNRHSVPNESKKQKDPFPSPPALSSPAYYGLWGDTVKMIEPQSEASPIAILVQGLVGLGNMIGREPHFVLDGDRIYTNLNAMIVGQTASSRKGTSLKRTLSVLREVDPDWASNILDGLSSGEGLIHAVRDAATFANGQNQVLLDPGVEDKRRLVTETEFVSVLRRAALRGNTVSSVIRNLFDNGAAQTLTKHSPQKATRAHVSIIGHITEYELAAQLGIDAFNGFGNRFLWVSAHKSKILPNCRGVDMELMMPLIRKMITALTFAELVGEMTLDVRAAKLGDKIYRGLEERRRALAPKIEALVARDYTHILRIAMIYALLDMSEVIKSQHIQAACAVWDFVEASISYIFGSKRC